MNSEKHDDSELYYWDNTKVEKHDDSKFFLFAHLFIMGKDVIFSIFFNFGNINKHWLYLYILLRKIKWTTIQLCIFIFKSYTWSLVE